MARLAERLLRLRFAISTMDDRFTKYPYRTVRDMAHEGIGVEEPSMCIHILEEDG